MASARLQSISFRMSSEAPQKRMVHGLGSMVVRVLARVVA
jgi:hypothetical protein